MVKVSAPELNYTGLRFISPCSDTGRCRCQVYIQVPSVSRPLRGGPREKLACHSGLWHTCETAILRFSGRPSVLGKVHFTPAPRVLSRRLHDDSPVKRSDYRHCACLSFGINAREMTMSMLYHVDVVTLATPHQAATTSITVLGIFRPNLQCANKHVDAAFNNHWHIVQVLGRIRTWHQTCRWSRARNLDHALSPSDTRIQS